jgi:hypothetical protein
MKKAIRGPKRPRMASMPLLSMVSQAYVAERNWKVVTQTSSAARELFRHARIQVLLCLSVASLVNAIPARFYAWLSTNAQCELMLQGDRSIFLRWNDC